NHTLGAFGQMWIHGIEVDLDHTTGTGRRKLRLPTYPFQRERCWIEPGTGSVLGGPAGGAVEHTTLHRIDDVDRMGLRTTWIDAPAPSERSVAVNERRWVVVGGNDAVAVADELRRRGRSVLRRPRFDPVDQELETTGECAGVVLAGRSPDVGAATSLWLDDAGAAV